MCVSICVALQEVQHHNTVAGGRQCWFSENMQVKTCHKRFFATDTLCMGYGYFFQSFTRCLLLNVLISTVSTLQILILEKFFLFFFLITAPIDGSTCNEEVAMEAQMRKGKLGVMGSQNFARIILMISPSSKVGAMLSTLSWNSDTHWHHGMVPPWHLNMKER